MHGPQPPARQVRRWTGQGQGQGQGGGLLGLAGPDPAEKVTDASSWGCGKPLSSGVGRRAEAPQTEADPRAAC